MKDFHEQIYNLVKGNSLTIDEIVEQSSLDKKKVQGFLAFAANEKTVFKNEEGKYSLTQEGLKLLTVNKKDDIKEEEEKSPDMELNSQTRDLLKRIRDEKLFKGGRSAFNVENKDPRFEYFWASTDNNADPSIESLRSIGWVEVKDARKILTGGFDRNQQVGKHILMKIPKNFYKELQSIQDELNQRKKDSIMGSAILDRSGGKNKMGQKVTADDADFLNG